MTKETAGPLRRGLPALLLSAALAGVLGIALASAAARGAHGAKENSTGAAAPGAGRDWAKHPAIVEREMPHDLYALGDVHGDYDRAVELLSAAKLIAGAPDRPRDARWTGGAAVLVCTGDLIDKFDQSLRVVELVRALEPQARAAGGEVIVTLGNHEAEFLASAGETEKKEEKKEKEQKEKEQEKEKSKTAEFAHELRAAGLSPADVAAGRDSDGIGAFLRDLPAAAKVGDWFFCHAGNTGGLTLNELRDGLQRQITEHGFAAPLLLDPDSMLEARMHPRPWWDAGAAPDLHEIGKKKKAERAEKSDHASAGEQRLRQDVEALGARRLVFGHQPGEVTFADGSVRRRGEVVEKFDGLVFLIDTGMSRGVDGGRGAVLWVRQGKHSGRPSATVVYADGKSVPLWPR